MKPDDKAEGAGTRRAWCGYAAVLIVAGILVYQLVLPPPVGLANNGDFGKVVGLFSLGAPFEDEYAYARSEYYFRPQYYSDSSFRSSEMFLAAIAVGLNRMVSKNGAFDMRVIGLVHSLLLILGMCLLQPLLAELPMWRRILLSAAAIFIFCDVMYVSWLASFYMDVATLLFLLLAIVLFLRAARWHRKQDAAWFLICVVLMVLSKPKDAALGLWVAAALVYCGIELWPGSWGRILSWAAAVIVLGAVVLGLEARPVDYPAHGCYTVIFAQVLPHSRDVAGDLTALGLDDSYRKWIGTHAFSEGGGMSDPAFVREFMKRTSYVRLGWYFLTHPRDAYLALRSSLGEGARQRPAMGNFDRSAGLPAFAESQAFAVWSNLKRRLFYGNGVRYLNSSLMLSLFVGGLATARRRVLGCALFAGVVALCGMSLTALLIAALADAAETTRHYLIFSALFDLEVLCGLVLTSGWVGGRTGNTPR